tara:strand:- start:9742 stop:9903 length:162 start_codon:yes stop_codon:yes gene_type:complete
LALSWDEYIEDNHTTLRSYLSKNSRLVLQTYIAISIILNNRKKQFKGVQAKLA